MINVSFPVETNRISSKLTISNIYFVRLLSLGSERIVNLVSSNSIKRNYKAFGKCGGAQYSGANYTHLSHLSGRGP